MKKPTRKQVLYTLLGLVLFGAVSLFAGVQYVKSRLFRDRPNTLTIEGDLGVIPFEWIQNEYENYIEQHEGILKPVSLPGLPNKFYMQFDTGSPYTMLRSGALESLREHGVEFEVQQTEEYTSVKNFEIDIAGGRVVLGPGRVIGRKSHIEWDNPDAINIIGSLGADFIDNKICAIDFPAETIVLYNDRPDDLKTLGTFEPFKFRGRRIMLPAIIDGSEVEVFYDSGCSAFGLLTSKYHYDRFSDSNDKEVAVDSSRHGEAVPIHHKPCDLSITLGSTELPLKRVSYAELYNFLQTSVGRFIGGGFLGNKSLTESTMILDTKANEFLVVPRSLQQPILEDSELKE